jgi:hypothetical protein
MLSLSQPRPALVAVVLAALATTGVGIPLAIVDFALAAPAFALGSAVLAVAAGWSCRRVLAEADFHYATAF